MTDGCANPQLDRVGRQLRADGVKDTAANPQRNGIHSRGYLPHIKREGAEYFVTFRLADSLPKEVLLRFEAEHAERLRALEKSHKSGASIADDRELIQRDFRRQLERQLDTGAGACWLGRAEVAELVAGALMFFHESRYVLREWVVMPNHVHALVWPMPNQTVGAIVKSWKQFTALRAKRLLCLADGRFWQPESYDHWVRDDMERGRIARYIRNNPVGAGLCERPEDWRWSSACLK